MSRHFKGAIWITGSSVIFIVSSYLMNIILARVLGVSEFGNYGVIIALLTAINLMQTAGIPQAITKFISADTDNDEAVVWKSFIIQSITGMLAATLLIASAPLLGVALNDISIINYIMASALVIPAYGYYYYVASVFNARQEFKKQATMIALYSVSKLFLGVVLTLIWGLYGVIVAFAISPLIALLSGFVMPRRQRSSTISYGAIIAYAGPVLIFAILSTLLQTIDLAVVKSAIGSEAAGYYTAAQNIVRIPFFLFSSLSLVMFPMIAVASNNSKQLGLAVSRLASVTILILPFIIALIASVPAGLLALLFGSEYVVGATTLAILAASYMFLTLFMLTGNILNALGKQRISMYIAGSAVIIQIIGALQLSVTEQANGVALATGIAAFWAFILGFIVVCKYVTVEIDIIKHTVPIAAAVIIFIIGYNLDLHAFSMAAYIFASFIFYAGVLIYTKMLIVADIMSKFSIKKQLQ